MISALDLSPEAQFAFAVFLSMEIRRHEQDIRNAKADLIRLKEMGVDIDHLPDWGFVVTDETLGGFA